MNDDILIPAIWPEHPPVPAGRPSLLRLPQAGPRFTARAATRAAARTILGAWCGHPIGLRETPRGPRPDGVAETRGLRLSFSYIGTEAWIAFHAGPVGLDVCAVADFPERAELTRLYLPGTSDDVPVEVFARRWARLEATLKYQGRGLSEHASVAAPRQLRDRTESGVALALAWD
jgi:hypothetical protein